jgi:hypothetical protein
MRTIVINRAVPANDVCEWATGENRAHSELAMADDATKEMRDADNPPELRQK